MRKFLALVAMGFFAACSSNESAKTDSMQSTDSTMQSTTQTAMQPINSPYPVSYSSSFAMGDSKNAESLLTLWKDWDNGDLSAHKDIFADSVEMHLSDGSMIHSVRDSVIASGQNFRNTIAKAVSSVDAITALKSTDKNENWALIWGKEIDTDKKGKIDSFYLHEVWRFNKDGKADLVFQYRQNSPRAK
jgi:hypothetical protein